MAESKIDACIINFSGVGKTFGLEVALRDVSFSVRPDEFVCFVGLSGSGKSTILRIIAGLEQPTSGSVQVPGSVAMVFQSGALFPWLNVYDNVAMGLRARRAPERQVRDEALKFIDLIGLSEFTAKFPHELSGGQRQRVGIARALAVSPQVLLLDEPFSALDVKTTDELHKDLMKIWRQMRTTIVMVSHLIEEAVTLAERVILVKDHTIGGVFPISLPHPRREQEAGFAHEVMNIRKNFFK